MAEITASMVKELRERTDAPMMDCKKALTEAAGDMQKAEEILRVRFGNKAAKSAGRVAAEGVVAIKISADGKTAAMVEVNCETDFVAKNDDFLALSNALAQMVIETVRLTSLPSPPFPLAARRWKKPAPNWSARWAKTCRSAALSD
jgi:elongation factor Ts